MWVNVSTNTMMKALANGVCDYWIKSLDANQIKCCKETFEWKWKTKKLMETYLEVEDKKKKRKRNYLKSLLIDAMQLWKNGSKEMRTRDRCIIERVNINHKKKVKCSIVKRVASKFC
jgi:hypothetical protein